MEERGSREEAQMDFSIPHEIALDLEKYESFLEEHLKSQLPSWYRQRAMPRDFFRELGAGGWLGYRKQNGKYLPDPALKHVILSETLAGISPGVAVSVGVHTSLGTLGLFLFGSAQQKETHFDAAIKGETLICLGNTEPTAGSDVAGIAARARPAEGGWVLNGTKAYATNGAISDLALITAVTDPDAPRNNRLSMFIVDLSSEGVSRKPLNKQVWIPSDLTRLHLEEVFVPARNLLGERGRGLQQVLEIFTHSRLSIGALALGTAVGAFDLGLEHAKKREVFGQKIVDFQAKSFEIADFYTRMEAARLMLWKACWTKEQGKDFRLEAAMAKYLGVEIARAVSVWAADLFGAASVIFEHPVHKFPMDAWAASLGEGTQDVLKLIIFRGVLQKGRF